LMILAARNRACTCTFHSFLFLLKHRGLSHGPEIQWRAAVTVGHLSYKLSHSKVAH